MLEPSLGVLSDAPPNMGSSLLVDSCRLCPLPLGVSARSTLSCPIRTLSTLSFFTLVDLALSLMALSSSSNSGPLAILDSVGTSFSSVVCRSASSIRWAGPSTPFVTILKSPLFSASFLRGFSLL